MKPKNIISTFLIILTFLLIISCSQDAVSIKFKVISTGNGFTGYYIVDDDDIFTYRNEVNDTDFEVYYIDREVELDKQIQITASADNDNDKNVTSLKIYIYKNNEKVAEAIGTGSPITFVDLDYTLETTQTE
ncbi:hypothetical protein ACFL20_07185 [Spirochaetota bacterium]